jgi:glycosyltransferase involved in cell wall biosynthesis
MDFEKDYSTFIKAGNKVLAERNDVTFVIVGDGEDRGEIQLSIKSDYQEKFVFTGQRSDVESIVNIFDVAVLATFTEGISNSIMEYMALSKPVIATNGGGTEELVVDGETGVLVSVGNEEELSKKIIQLLNNPELGHQMGVNGGKRLIKEFSFEKMINNYINTYDAIQNLSGILHD